MAAGDAYGIRQLGTMASKNGTIGSGWFVAAVPVIYTREDMREYWEWLGADTMEANLL